jgi:hypothetical protein
MAYYNTIYYTVERRGGVFASSVCPSYVVLSAAIVNITDLLEEIRDVIVMRCWSVGYGMLIKPIVVT